MRQRRQDETEEAVQIEADEAVQIEAQALVLERVIRDTSSTRLPATAWPRQTLAAYTARPSRGHGGVVDGWLLALGRGRPKMKVGWWGYSLL